MPYLLINRFRGALVGGFVGETSTHPDLNERARHATYSDEIEIVAQSIIANRTVSPVGEDTERAIVSTIPIALYCHDDTLNLRQVLLETTPQPSQDVSFVVAESIAAALRPQMEPFKLLPELVQLLPDEALAQKLRQVQRLLIRRDSLAIAVQKLGDAPPVEVAIALAFYCWLSTAEQYQLSVLRAHRIPNVSALTLLLTGAFSGTLNGEKAIPMSWLTPGGALQLKLQLMETLAEQLLATWSGFNQVGEHDENASDSVAIASPGILRPR